MPRRSAGNPEPPDHGRHAEAIVAEKLKVLSLIRALDRAGVDPREVRSLQPTLVRLAEYDGFLTAALEVLDRDRGTGGTADLGPIEEFLGVGREVRGEVLGSLPHDRRREVLRWVEEVPAHAREVWMEVEAMRRRSGRGSPPRMRSEEEIQRVAEKTFGAARPRAAPVDPRVRRHEKKPLAARDDLPTWLARLPKGWLETIAGAHGLDASGRKPRIVAELAAHLRGKGLAAAVNELLGPEERTSLAHLALVGQMPVDALPDDMQAGLEVAWEWRNVPPGVLARLRGLGLAFVGSSGGRRFVAMPGELRQPVLELIEREHKEVFRTLQRALRASAAERSKELPFEDQELARWKAADRAVGNRLGTARE